MTPESLERLRLELERPPNSPGHVVHVYDLRAILAAFEEVVAALRGEVAARKRIVTEPYEVSREWTRQQKVDAILAKYPVKP